MKTLIEEYNEFVDLIMKISIESQKYEISAWIRRIKKELSYFVVFEQDLQIEDFLNLINKELKNLDEKNQSLIIPHLRDFKFRMLNI
jgi:hypothetical protein